jgi:hypothetical protein
MSIRNRSVVRLLSLLALVCATAAAPSRIDAQSAGCVAEPSSARDSIPDLAGVWDFAIETSNGTSKGFLALGHMDGAYAGSLTPAATNTVVIRRLTVQDDSVHMSVATREGEVTFDGRVARDGTTMCGTVTYHDGVLYPMVATRRAKGSPA